MLTTLQRWGGILIHPKVTLAAMRDGSLAAGRWDGWLLPLVFVLGCQTQQVVEVFARFVRISGVLTLIGGLAMVLLVPIFAALLLEGLIGSSRARYRHLPLVPLVLLATLGNLLRQLGVALPGPQYLPEILGTLWGVGLAVWIRQVMPEDADADAAAAAAAAEPASEVQHG
ncbi:hypothetical protein G6O69_03475 [Pseudenhygromyxa sp. WMMC2535]|uniref:hypothetical protein n=1 Tax=Pseudenhygromyxa sp. WMMC2535 TaxID=2712867 RepID=UPI0015537AAE|nr:hypothetical protein [Pseudenhygromyxa sp. WMMC2535]NVB36875.1 hypothetical protein [Pseudenhygromyxa sp. WMMC2535]